VISSTQRITSVEAIDAALCQLGSEILPLRHLEPVNGEEERERFFSRTDYNPQFVYLQLTDEQYRNAIERLQAIHPDASPIGQLFLHTRNYLHRRLELRRAVGGARFWDPSLYEVPSEELVQIAERILDAGLPEEEFTTDAIHGAERMRAMFEQALRQHGLTDWKVISRAHISSTNVESANRLVIVRADGLYSMTMMKRLVVHEIETHVLRAANGYLQPLRIFGAAVIPGYLATEEGLALVNEERAGYVDNERLRLLAARVIASHLALLTSFREIYQRLRDYGLGEQDAWITVKRVKRGLGDTALPGGFIKDHVYLWGKIKLEQYLVAGGDLARLYVGKIGLEMIDLVEQLGMQPPRYLPRSYQR
jgi:uncharacterized protein (TIGR02421 family)